MPETIEEQKLPEIIEEQKLPETIEEQKLPETIEEQKLPEALEGNTTNSLSVHYKIKYVYVFMVSLGCIVSLGI